jgi:Helix-turn-helix domain
MKDDHTTPEKEAALKALRDVFKGTDTKTQCRRLLEALSRFPVTTFEAMRHLDIYHVPARILQLRKAGHPIVTLWRIVITEAGAKHRVGLYVLRHNVEQGGAA